jgi:hypothetical protein
MGALYASFFLAIFTETSEKSHIICSISLRENIVLLTIIVTGRETSYY